MNFFFFFFFSSRRRHTRCYRDWSSDVCSSDLLKSRKEESAKMQCTSCGSDNPEEARFCIECAAPLKKRCPSCGAENLPRAKFCAECATPLTRQSTVTSSQPPAPYNQSP